MVPQCVVETGIWFNNKNSFTFHFFFQRKIYYLEFPILNAVFNRDVNKHLIKKLLIKHSYHQKRLRHSLWMWERFSFKWNIILVQPQHLQLCRVWPEPRYININFIKWFASTWKKQRPQSNSNVICTRNYFRNLSRIKLRVALFFPGRHLHELWNKSVLSGLWTTCKM